MRVKIKIAAQSKKMARLTHIFNYRSTRLSILIERSKNRA